MKKRNTMWMASINTNLTDTTVLKEAKVMYDPELFGKMFIKGGLDNDGVTPKILICYDTRTRARKRLKAWFDISTYEITKNIEALTTRINMLRAERVVLKSKLADHKRHVKRIFAKEKKVEWL